ncbi:MAG: peptide-methionine (S)-S-oxide reductase MsrA [Candidatus Thermoplasmatota archaeon]
MIEDYELGSLYIHLTVVLTLLNSLFDLGKNPEDLVTKETPEIDKKKHDGTKNVTFSMGCFWGPDSLFGAIPGVIRTKVGYAGGSKKDPTYHSLGDHTETIQVNYDPGEVSYEELIDLFWENHDPTFSKSTQYMSIIFFHDEEQEKIAERTKERRDKKSSETVKTEIRPYSKFYTAEDYHQKYHLSQHKALYKAYQNVYPDIEDFTDSTAVTRANGYVSGHGKITSEEELKELGLSEEGRKILFKKWRSDGGADHAV